MKNTMKRYRRSRQTTNAADHANSLKFDGCPAALVVQSGTADRDHEAGRPIGLLLFEGGSKVIGANVAMQLKMLRFVAGCVAVRKHNNGRGSEFSEEGADHLLHFWCEVKDSVFFFYKPITGRMRQAMSGRNLRL